jgi:hypothetical protein
MKVAMERDAWIPAVNNAGLYVEWAILEVRDVQKQKNEYDL